MQKLKLSVIGFCCLLAVSRLCAQSWQHADVSATALEESGPDIAVEADGTAHIVFQQKHASGGRDIFYVNTEGNTLSAPLQITNFAAEVWYPAIALDAWGNAHVAFENRTNKTVVYLNNVGGSFSLPVEFGDPGSTGADHTSVLGVSLDVDVNGFAHIVYYVVYYGTVAGINNHLFYATNTSSSFVVTDLGSFGFPQGALQPHIDEKSGVIHIAFVGEFDFDWAIYYITNSGSGFGSPILVTDGDDLGDHPTISVEQNGTVHVVSDVSTISGIYHSVSNGSGGFDTEQVLGPGFWFADHALGPSNEIGIAVTPNPNNPPQDGILLLTNESGSWSSDVIIPPGAVEDVVEYGAWFGHGIAIDGDGYVHVVGRQAITTRRGKGKKKIVNLNHNVRYHTNNPNFSPGGPPPPPSDPTIHVEKIEMSTEPAKGNGWKAVADVLIHDDQGQPVDGASVSGSWSGLVSGSSTATTGSNGVATLKSPKTKKSGEIFFTVTDVTKGGFSYEPNSNVEGSINGPPAAKVSAGQNEAGSPIEFALFGNHPNPFNPETRIRFALPDASHVEITIYNTRGQIIRRLVSQSFPAGEHAMKWDGQNDFGANVASGTYLYKIQAGEFTATRKMALVR